MSRLLRGVLPSLLVCCSLLMAQNWQHMTGPGDSEVSLRIKPVVGPRLGGLGYLLVRMENIGPRPRRFHLNYATRSYSQGNVRVNKSVVLAPHHTERLFLPLPSIPESQAELRAPDLGDLSQSLSWGTDPGGAVLFVGGPYSSRPAYQRFFTTAGMEPRVVAPEDLPPDWSLLSTFRAAIIDESAALDADHQELLRRFAAAGGTVVALGAEPLRAGPLRELIEQHEQPLIPIGFGVIASAPAPGPSVHDLLFRLGYSQERLAAVLPTQYFPAVIPGLGGVPVRTFLVLILLFALVVGPINFLVLRRRKKQLLAVFTVPLLGFGMTAVMLIHGILQDGFGTQGVVRSIAVLDQQRHAGAGATSQTLFAGLGPAWLEVPAGTVVESLPALMSTRNSRGLSAFRYEVDRPGLGGELLPSRTPTTLVTTQQRPERTRLRLRMHGEGAVMGGANFVPEADQPFLVRDHQGDYFELHQDKLLPCDESRARQVIDGVVARYLAVDLMAAELQVASNPLLVMSSDGQGARLRQRLLGADGGLPPGSYLGCFGSVPWLDDHGLEIDYHEAVHIVRGQLAAEDIVQ